MLFCALLLTGVVLQNHSVDLLQLWYWNRVIDAERPVLEYVVSSFLGSLFIGLGLCYFSIVLGLLSLVEAAGLMFSFVMMSFFEIMGLDWIYWVLMVFFPTVGIIGAVRLWTTRKEYVMSTKDERG